MIVDLGAYGFFLLAPIFALSLISGALAIREPVGPAAVLQVLSARLLFPLFAFVLFSLIWALVIDDYDLLFVAQNTNPATPLIYKIVGVWGNHEGSLILWQLILAVFLLILSWRPEGMPGRTHALAMLILVLIIAGFYGFSALLANPFQGNGQIPPGSGDLNVLLQDFGQIIHPPLLYLGYTAAGVTFAVAVAILVDRKLSSDWVDWLRPWALTSWTFLTAGIALGSFWAYYELGWGGWWFWDPVENLALLPWILGTALIHSLQTVRARQQLAGWSMLLSILTFLMVVLGTFIVRSGLLTSVHAFASDPDRGLYLLIMLGVVSVIGLGAYAYGTRHHLPQQQALTANRHGVLLLNNLLLMALFAAVMAGTLAPTLIELLGGETYVVRERFYVPTFVYPSLILFALMSLGVWTRWSEVGVQGMRLLTISFIGLLGLAVILIFTTSLPVRAGLMFALGGWVLLATIAAWLNQMQGWERIRRMPLRSHGWALAHVGLAIAILGMSASSLLSQERIFELRGAETREFFGQTFEIRQRIWLPGENYQSLATAIEIPGRGVRITETRLYHPLAAGLNPAGNQEHREFLADQGEPASEAAIFRGWLFDTFINVQDRAGGAPLMTVARKAGINWIWTGAIFMTIGGIFALLPVRRRGVRG